MMQREGAASGFEIRFIDSAKGRGLFATKLYKSEETVFTEFPAASLQHYENRSQVMGIFDRRSLPANESAY